MELPRQTPGTPPHSSRSSGPAHSPTADPWVASSDRVEGIERKAVSFSLRHRAGPTGGVAGLKPVHENLGQGLEDPVTSRADDENAIRSHIETRGPRIREPPLVPAPGGAGVPATKDTVPSRGDHERGIGRMVCHRGDTRIADSSVARCPGFASVDAEVERRWRGSWSGEEPARSSWDHMKMIDGLRVDQVVESLPGGAAVGAAPDAPAVGADEHQTRVCGVDDHGHEVVERMCEVVWLPRLSGVGADRETPAGGGGVDPQGVDGVEGYGVDIAALWNLDALPGGAGIRAAVNLTVTTDQNQAWLQRAPGETFRPGASFRFHR